MSMKIAVVGIGNWQMKVESKIQWTILGMEGLFTGQDVIEAVNKKLGKDYSAKCWEVLDRLLDTPLVEYVGQDKEKKNVYITFWLCVRSF